MIDKLISKIIEKETPIVVGLDPRLEYLPQNLLDKYFKQDISLETAARAILDFNIEILSNIHDLIPAVKLQVAYYEMYGLPGLKTFIETANYAKSKGLIVIGDVKRNDIGSTAEAYSNAYIGYTPLYKEYAQAFPVDMITVNPYLGTDGIKPFIDNCKRNNKGIFVLVKTSNPSSGEFQDLVTADGYKVYEKVAQKVNDWGQDLTGNYGYSSVGAVIGATYPHQLSELRKLMPNVYFLVPGYGAQGGRAQDIMGGFDNRGLGSIINASRSIMCAYKNKPWKNQFNSREFGLASRAEVINMKDEIHKALISNKTYF
ncbi:MAG: orotidine-5'-phosphate decarboxylase [Caldicoprobacterales bacterium]